MPLIELKDYTLRPEGAGKGLSDISFSLLQSDVCSIQADRVYDATLFLKALATLVYPVRGTYRFDGEEINLSDYRASLSCKRRIGYIAPGTAMISNRTVRENLLFMRYFYEDSLSISLDENMEELCRKFDILDKLDRKPGELHPQDIQNAITIRELCKSPDVLLLERPEDFIDNTKIDSLIKVLKDLSLSRLAIVLFSFEAAYEAAFEAAFSFKNVKILNGNVTIAPS